MRLFSIGSIVSFSYSNWKTNPKRIYCFILFSMGEKVHALNIGAKQLNTMERTKLIHIIAKLGKSNFATKWTGRTLYRIFKAYAPNETKKCYRTYHNNGYINRPALINKGLNPTLDTINKTDFNEWTWRAAKKDFLVNFLDLYTGRGVKLEEMKNTFANPSNTNWGGSIIDDSEQQTLFNKTTIDTNGAKGNSSIDSKAQPTLFNKTTIDISAAVKAESTKNTTASKTVKNTTAPQATVMSAKKNATGTSKPSVVTNTAKPTSTMASTRKATSTTNKNKATSSKPSVMSTSSKKKK